MILVAGATGASGSAVMREFAQNEVFPDYFRVELSWAKLFGVVLLLAPVPARLKEWAAHLAVGDGPEGASNRSAPGAVLLLLAPSPGRAIADDGERRLTGGKSWRRL